MKFKCNSVFVLMKVESAVYECNQAINSADCISLISLISIVTYIWC